MNAIMYVFHVLGSLICHQLPSRTLQVGGFSLPVCARDTGIYFGVFVSSVYLFMRGRFKADAPPPVGTSILLCFFMLPMLLDALSSYAGLRETNNTIRLFSGIAFGLSLPVFLLPALHFRVDAPNRFRVIQCPGEIFLPAAAAAAGGYLILAWKELPWFFPAVVTVFSLFFILIRLIYTIVRKLWGKNGRAAVLFTLLAFAGTTGILFVVNRFIVRPLSAFLSGR